MFNAHGGNRPTLEWRIMAQTFRSSVGRHPWTLLLGAVGMAMVLGQAAMSLEPASMVYVDDSPAAEALFQTAAQRHAAVRLTQAAETYQQLIDEYGQRLTLIGERLYGPVADEVERRLLADDELLAAWRRRFEPAARLLMDALETAGHPRDDPLRFSSLNEVTQRYRLTTAGLQATHELAALRLEAAQPARALRLLERVAAHPDLRESATAASAGDRATRKSTQRWLTAAALALSGQTTQAQALVASMPRSMVTAELDEQVAALIRAPIGSPQPRRPPLDIATVVGSGSDGPLWTTPMPAVAESYLDRRMHPTAGAAYIAALHMQPVVRGEVAYVNTGGAVVAMDVSCGRELWRYTHVPAWAQPGPTGQPLSRPAVPDFRSLVLTDNHSGGRLLAILGYGAAARPGSGGVASTTAVVCLDPVTGRQIWLMTLGEMARHIIAVDRTAAPDKFEDAYFHGTPTVHEGLVLVLIRRHGVGNSLTEHLAAMDVIDGRPHWARHIASSVTSDRSLSQPPLGTLLVVNGLAYVADEAGAVGCVDLEGQVRWTYTLPSLAVELAAAPALGRSGSAPWRVSAPVMLPAGLLVPLPSPSQGALVLDPHDGHRLRTLNGAAWAAATTAVPLDNDLLVVGRQVSRLDGTTLEPRWQVALSDPAAGRPAVVDERIWLATEQHMIVLRAEDGHEIARADVMEPGHVSPTSSGLLLAAADLIHGYLSWDVAYANLRRQITETPEAADPALSLAHLAARHGRDTALRWACDHALAAVQRSAAATDSHAARDVVFDELLSVVRQLGARPAMAAEVLDRAETVVRSPGQTVLYHLTRGQILEQLGDPAAALEQYQVLLDEPSLASRMITHGPVTRRVAGEATARIGAIIEAAGLAVYRPYAMAAEQELRAMGPSPAAEPLVALAKRYPYAEAGGRALLAASGEATGSGAWTMRVTDQAGDDAIHPLLQQAYRHMSDRAMKVRIASRLATMYEQRGHALRAAWWVRRIANDFPDALAWRGGQQITTLSWLFDLAERQPQTAMLPRVTAPLHAALSVPGYPLVPLAMPRGSGPKDLVLTLDGTNVLLRRPPSFEPSWRQDLGESTVDLLYIDGELALLWLDQSSRVVALRLDDGQPAYEAIDVFMLLSDIRHDDQPAAELRDAPVVEQPLGAHDIDVRMLDRLGLCRGAVNAQVAVFVAATGSAAAVETDTGRTLWQRQLPLDHVTHFDLSTQALAVGGVIGRERGLAYTAALLVDLATGEVEHEVSTAPEPLQLLELVDNGLLVGTPQALRLVDLNGQPGWERREHGATLTPWTLTAGDLAMVRTRDAGMRLFRLEDGGEIALPPHLAAAEPAPMDLLVTLGRWHLLGPSHATCLDDRGDFCWRDAVARTGSESMLTQFAVEGRMIVLTAVDEAGGGQMRPSLRSLQSRKLRVPHPPTAYMGPFPRQDGAGYRYQLYFFDAADGRLTAEQPVGPLAEPIDTRRSLAIEGHLILATSTSSLILPDAAP